MRLLPAAVNNAVCLRKTFIFQNTADVEVGAVICPDKTVIKEKKRSKKQADNRKENSWKQDSLCR